MRCRLKGPRGNLQNGLREMSEERRIVTILFADVTVSTEEHLASR